MSEYQHDATDECEKDHDGSNWGSVVAARVAIGPDAPGATRLNDVYRMWSFTNVPVVPTKNPRRHTWPTTNPTNRDWSDVP